MPKEGKLNEDGTAEDGSGDDETTTEGETWADRFKTPQELADEVNRQHDIIEKTKAQNTEFQTAIKQAAVDVAVMNQVIEKAIPNLDLDEVVVDTRFLKVDGRSGEVTGIRVALPEIESPGTGKRQWKPRFSGTQEKETPGTTTENPDDIETAERALAFLRNQDKKKDT